MLCSGRILEDFGQSENVLKHCVHLVQNSSNDYSILYGLNVIEVGCVCTCYSVVTLFGLCCGKCVCSVQAK